MVGVILAIALEVVKVLGKAFLTYYSPEEIKARREAKRAAETKEAKKEIKNAIVDENLNSLALALNERILNKLRQPDQDPKRYRDASRLVD